jgi:hypothetical protein
MKFGIVNTKMYQENWVLAWSVFHCCQQTTVKIPLSVGIMAKYAWTVFHCCQQTTAKIPLSVSIMAKYGPGESGIQSRRGQKWYTRPIVWTGSGTHSPSWAVSTRGCFPGGSKDLQLHLHKKTTFYCTVVPIVYLLTHLHLVLKIRMHGGEPPISLSLYCMVRD